ncbi:MAG TPA: hypothetical protein VNB90_11595 [Cytophagaceae bacterium]|jgi:hypothetical protein|nr:hypothetical protein [Cytophagaceae bacterium]
MEELLKEIGARLKKYLDYKDISINQMGKMSENEGTQIYNIVNGRNYGVDKFLKVIKQANDLNLYWLLWNDGGEENMLKKDASKIESSEEEKLSRELLQNEINSLKSTIAYQDITIDVYKNALDISKASIEDLRKMVDFYASGNNLNDKNDQFNSNAG